MKKLFRVLLIYIALCVCFAHVALADTATAGTSTMTVFDDIVHLLAYALGVTIMGLVTLGVNKLRQRWGLEVPATWLAKVQSTIDMGIAYAEEQAHKAVEGTKLASNEKLEMAMKFVLRIAGDDKKLVKLGEEKIKQLIEARLAQTRQPYTTAMLSSTTKENS